VTTINALRTRLRTRLEESTAAVWSDAELDECLSSALADYSARFPAEAEATISVANGATFATLPGEVLSMRRVISGDGVVIPSRGAPTGSAAGEELAWERFGDRLYFSRPLAAQTLTIWFRAMHDVSTLPAMDEELVILLAVAAALDARAIQDAKRGIPIDRYLLQMARNTAERALDRRGRRLRVSALA